MHKEIPKVLLLINTSRESGRKLLHGITKYSRLHGPWTFNLKPAYFYENQAEPNQSKRWEKETFARLKQWGANGVIATNVNNSRQLGKILALNLPSIILGGYKPPKPTSKWHRIYSDAAAIGKMAAEHLLERGFRRFAYCGYYGSSWSEERGVGFAKRIAEAGFETQFYKSPRSRVKRLWENEQAIMADWLKTLPKPCGLMVCNDDRGQQLLEAFKIAGLHVPDEVAVIGVDNDALICEVSEPPLSSISLNNERAGYEAAALLAKLMAGSTMAHQEIVVQPATVVTRESTDNLAIEDSTVAQAVRFIRQHTTDIIQVSDVVNAVAMSRRTLERNFRKVLGHSMLDEIRRVHVSQFAKMLIETNLPVSQIAVDLGHADFKNISRYFRKEKGMSPLAYRKKHGYK